MEFQSTSENTTVFKSLDWITVGLYLVLVVLGAISIYAASYNFDHASMFSFQEFSGKQFLWIGFALIIGFALLMIDRRVYEAYAYPIYAFMMLLLAVTIVIAPNVKGSHSWIVLGPVSLQPAEFAKFATALALAKLFNTYNFALNSAKHYAIALGIKVNIYLEDWSNGMKDSRDFTYGLIDGVKDLPIGHYILPDTLGVLTPQTTYEYLTDIQSHYPQLTFDFHAHNDYGMAIGNVSAALRAKCLYIHTAVNGLGERAGNAPLASVQAVIKDFYGYKTNIKEKELYRISRIVEGYSGIPIPSNEPVVGENVFTQVAGVHADGDRKHNLYSNALVPERFGRKREYALGKNSGRANVLKNLESLGLELTPEETKRVTQRVVELADRKEMVTQDDLPYIISDVLKHDTAEQRVKLLGYFVTNSYGLKPTASLKIEIDGQVYETNSSGDGQYDAFVRGVRHIYQDILKHPFPRLVDYVVRIPPGGRTDAFVQTIITWDMLGKTLRSHALDPDQTEAAIKATIKMLNQIDS